MQPEWASQGIRPDGRWSRRPYWALFLAKRECAWVRIQTLIVDPRAGWLEWLEYPCKIWSLNDFKQTVNWCPKCCGPSSGLTESFTTTLAALLHEQQKINKIPCNHTGWLFSAFPQWFIIVSTEQKYITEGIGMLPYITRLFPVLAWQECICVHIYNKCIYIYLYIIYSYM